MKAKKPPRPLGHRVSLVRSAYQPRKDELENTEAMLDFPDGTTADDLATAVVQPVEIDWKDRPR